MQLDVDHFAPAAPTASASAGSVGSSADSLRSRGGGASAASQQSQEGGHTTSSAMLSPYSPHGAGGKKVGIMKALRDSPRNKRSTASELFGRGPGAAFGMEGGGFPTINLMDHDAGIYEEQKSVGEKLWNGISQLRASMFGVGDHLDSSLRGGDAADAEDDFYAGEGLARKQRRSSWCSTKCRQIMSNRYFMLAMGFVAICVAVSTSIVALHKPHSQVRFVCVMYIITAVYSMTYPTAVRRASRLAIARASHDDHQFLNDPPVTTAGGQFLLLLPLASSSCSYCLATVLAATLLVITCGILLGYYYARGISTSSSSY